MDKKLVHPLGGRDLDEWIGKTPNVAVPKRVADRIFVRALGRCHLSGIAIRAGDKWILIISNRLLWEASIGRAI